VKEARILLTEKRIAKTKMTLLIKIMIVLNRLNKGRAPWRMTEDAVHESEMEKNAPGLADRKGFLDNETLFERRIVHKLQFHMKTNKSR
jgi:hypothetical protein